MPLAGPRVSGTGLPACAPWPEPFPASTSWLSLAGPSAEDTIGVPSVPDCLSLPKLHLHPSPHTHLRLLLSHAGQPAPLQEGVGEVVWAATAEWEVCASSSGS